MDNKDLADWLMTITRITLYFLLALCIILQGGNVLADIYRFQDEDGVWHFTNINNDVRYKLFIKTYAKKPEKYIKDFSEFIERASREYGIEPSLIKAVIKAESYFDDGAVSSKGAKGLMQLMPKTADALNVENPFNPEENILGGTRYLSQLLDRFNNDKKLALAAYNAGPSNVDEYKGIPPFVETRDFVDKVLTYYSEYKNGGM